MKPVVVGSQSARQGACACLWSDRARVMAASAAKPATGRRARRRSLRWHLLVPLNAAVVVTVASFLVWDAATEWGIHLREKQAALTEEAEILLPAALLQRGEPEALQKYLDDVCGRAQESTSPGHHIAARVDAAVFQARSHRRDSEAMFRAMEAAAARPDHLAQSENGWIVIGAASHGKATVWISERLDDVHRVLTRQILRRIASVLFLGAAVAVVVNVLVARLVARPLRDVVDSVRKVRAGELGALASTSGTEELGFLADEFNAMSAALAEADRERRRQMERARRIQGHLHPSAETAAAMRLAFLYEPADEVGGDYFDVRARPDGAALVCLADVTGHGVPAAMAAAVLKTLLVSAAARTGAPDQVLAQAGEGFASLLLGEDFASMIVVAADRAAGQLRYASAGHSDAYLVPREGPARHLAATGP